VDDVASNSWLALWHGAFFRALRVGPRLAALVGTVVVDVEEVPLNTPPTSADTAVAAAATAAATATATADATTAAAATATAASTATAAATAATDATTAADTDADAITVGGGDNGAEGDGVDGEAGAHGFELVSVCRRMTLAQFYTMLRPALQQIAVDRPPTQAAVAACAAAAAPLHSSDADAAAATTGAAGAGASTGGLVDEDDGLCSICMDGSVEVVTRCGHAYCEECYVRWLTLSRECPLCRERLALELTGTNHGTYALLSLDRDLATNTAASGWSDGGSGGAAGGGDGEAEGAAAAAGERVDAAWLRARLRGLPAVSEPRRHAHEQWMAVARRARENDHAVAAAAAAAAAAAGGGAASQTPGAAAQALEFQAAPQATGGGVGAQAAATGAAATGAEAAGTSGAAHR
jgi:hypothetical protein